MDYLGLGPDDAYDDYDDYDEPEPAPRPRRASHEPEPRQGRGYPEHESEGVVRTVPSRPTFPTRDFDPSQARRQQQAADESGVQPRPRGTGASTRSTVVATSEPTTVRPRRFDQAQEVADRFKEGQPVIMNIEGTEREVARRLIDFASGLCYALDGSMEKVATGVYLLRPITARSGRHDDYDD
jgi:cell division inhibitor SepF